MDYNTSGSLYQHSFLIPEDVLSQKMSSRKSIVIHFALENRHFMAILMYSALQKSVHPLSNLVKTNVILEIFIKYSS